MNKEDIAKSVANKILTTGNVRFFAKRHGENSYELMDGTIAIFKPGDFVIRMFSNALDDSKQAIYSAFARGLIKGILRDYMNNSILWSNRHIVKEYPSYKENIGWRCCDLGGVTDFYISDLFNGIVIVVPAEHIEEATKEEDLFTLEDFYPGAVFDCCKRDGTVSESYVIIPVNHEFNYSESDMVVHGGHNNNPLSLWNMSPITIKENVDKFNDLNNKKYYPGYIKKSDKKVGFV